VTGYDSLKPRLDRLLASNPRAFWIDKLKSAGVPCGSVRDLHEVFTDPQTRARGMLVDLEHAAAGALQVIGMPIKFSETPGGGRTPPPTLGQHTEAVLTDDLGLNGADIDTLRAKGVI
jgi:formyl-CoA transferase